MALDITFTIEETSNCKNIDITETTGDYNEITNPGGYGAPNITIDDVDEATITVIDMNAEDESYEIDVSDTLPNTDSEPYQIVNTDIGLETADKIPSSIYQFTYCLTGDFAITAVDTGTDTFTISGNRSGVFIAGDTFTVTGSTGNNATYTVESITYSDPNTLIVVTGDISDATVDGNINFEICTTIYRAIMCSAYACLDNKLKAITITDCKDCSDNKLQFASKISTYLKVIHNQVSCGKINHALTTLNYINELCAQSSCTSC